MTYIKLKKSIPKQWRIEELNLDTVVKSSKFCFTLNHFCVQIAYLIILRITDHFQL